MSERLRYWLVVGLFLFWLAIMLVGAIPWAPDVIPQPP